MHVSARRSFLEFRNVLRANDAQLADRKIVATQHRSRAEIAQSAIFFNLGGVSYGEA